MLSGHRFEPRRDGAGGEALPALRGATKLTHIRLRRSAKAALALDRLGDTIAESRGPGGSPAMGSSRKALLEEGMT